MTDSSASLVLKVDTTDTTKATVDLDKLTAAGEKTEQQFNKSGKAASSWQQNMAGVDASMRSTADRSIELAQSTQRLIDRYDPLGTKLRQLQSDMAEFQRVMGNSTSDAAMKTFQGLEADIERTSKLMSTAGVAGFEDMAKGAEKSAFATAGAKRELLVLGHEALTGNFSKIPGSFMVLAERMDLTTMLMSPMTLGIVGIGAAAVVMAVAFAKGASEAHGYTDALTLTGNAAGTTTLQLQAMADVVSKSSSSTVHAAALALTEFANSGRFASDQLSRLSESAINMEKATGTSIGDTVKHFIELGNSPVSASEKLNSSMHYLTSSTYEQIKSLQDQGKTVEAATAAQNAYSDAINSRASGVVANLGTIEKAWRGVLSAIKSVGDTAMGIGREVDPSVAIQSAIAAEQSKIERLRGLGAGKDTQIAIAAEERKLSLLNQQLIPLAQEQRTKEILAEIEADANRKASAGIEYSKLHEQYLTRELQMKREIDKITNVGAEAGTDQSIINSDIARVKARYASAAGHQGDEFAADRTAMEAWARAMKDADAAVDKASGRVELLTDNERKLRDLQTSESALLWDKLVPGSLAMVESRYKQAIADDKLSAANKAYAEALKAVDAAGTKELSTLDAKIKKQIEHNAEIGKTKSQVEALRSAQEDADMESVQREDDAIKALLYQGDLMDVLGDKDREIYIKRLAYLDQVLAKQKQYSAALTDGAAKEANAAAVADQNKEWKKGWEETDKLARTVFTDWAKDGSNAAQKIGDTLKKALLSAIYEATLKPLVMQVYTSIAGGGGASTALQAASGGGLLGSTGSMLGGFGSTIATGFMNTLSGTGMMAGLQSAGAMMGNGFMAQGLGMAAGALGPLAIGIGALSAISKAMQYTVTPTGGGLTATLGAGGVTNGQVGSYNQYQQVGGLGGGGTTTNRDWSTADAGTTQYIDQTSKALSAASKALADSLGLDTSAMGTFSKAIEINTTGMDAAAAKTAIDTALMKFNSDLISGSVGPAFASLAKSGETSSQTLARLSSSLVGVNGMFGAMGTALLKVGLSGAAAAANLVSAFGSLQNMQAQISQAVKNYATPDQQRNMAFDAGAADLRGVGINVTSAQLHAMTREQVASELLRYQQAAAATGATQQQQDQLAHAVAVANSLSTYVPAFAGTAPAAQAAAAAIGGTGTSLSSSGNTLTGAISALGTVAQSATDAIFAEVQRIRGLVAGPGVGGLANSESNFAIATAQARAGDQTALAALPGLSQAMLTLADGNAHTLQELNLIRAQTAASLSTTGSLVANQNGLTIPSFDVGTNMVPQDMIAMVHKGEAIVPAQYNPANGGGGATSQDVVAEIRALRADNAAMQAELIQIKFYSKRTADVTEKSDAIGPAPARAYL